MGIQRLPKLKKKFKKEEESTSGYKRQQNIQRLGLPWLFIFHQMDDFFYLFCKISWAMPSNQILVKRWDFLNPVLTERLNQKKLKMKLTQKEVDSFINFLNALKEPMPSLLKLEKILPKTTLEILRGVHERGVSLTEAEKIAVYLTVVVNHFQFQNTTAFDENTSHLIARDWQEIDYSGENMTWEKQREKYAVYGISNFKTEANLIKFIPVESKLPYFKKIYRPRNQLMDFKYRN